MRAVSYCREEHVTDEGLAHLKGWKKLESLNVRGTKITDTGLEHISALTSLRSLDAGFAQVTNNGLDYLSALTNLKRLAIGGNKTSDSGLHFLKLLPGLTSLDVSGSQRTDSGLWLVALTDAGLEPIASLHRLEELNLGGTKIRSWTGQAEGVDRAALSRSEPDHGHGQGAGEPGRAAEIDQPEFVESLAHRR